MGFFNTPVKYALGLAAMGLVFLGIFIYGLKTGKVHGSSTVADREENPSMYLISMIFILAMTCLCFALAYIVILKS